MSNHITSKASSFRQPTPFPIPPEMVQTIRAITGKNLISENNLKAIFRIAQDLRAYSVRVGVVSNPTGSFALRNVVIAIEIAEHDAEKQAHVQGHVQGHVQRVVLSHLIHANPLGFCNRQSHFQMHPARIVVFDSAIPNPISHPLIHIEIQPETRAPLPPRASWGNQSNQTQGIALWDQKLFWGNSLSKPQSEQEGKESKSPTSPLSKLPPKTRKEIKQHELKIKIDNCLAIGKFTHAYNLCHEDEDLEPLQSQRSRVVKAFYKKIKKISKGSNAIHLLNEREKFVAIPGMSHEQILQYDQLVASNVRNTYFINDYERLLCMENPPELSNHLHNIMSTAYIGLSHHAHAFITLIIHTQAQLTKQKPIDYPLLKSFCEMLVEKIDNGAPIVGILPNSPASQQFALLVKTTYQHILEKNMSPLLRDKLFTGHMQGLKPYIFKAPQSA